MLMITRRPGERILIGDDVTIEVVEVTGGAVRIGISAPRELPVYREELLRDTGRKGRAGGGPRPR